MGGRSRLRIFGNRVRGARISLQRARERAELAAREADAAECLLWSAQMEGFGGPAQPSPTVARHVPACRLTRSAARPIRQSGNWKPRSNADPAARRATRRALT